MRGEWLEKEQAVVPRPTNFSKLTRSSTLLENPRIVQELYLAFQNNYKP